MEKDIFERERAGEIISLNDPEYGKIAELITEAQKIIADMNTGYKARRKSGIYSRSLQV
jgi:hypothetical protein